MKITNAISLLAPLLITAGCESYSEHRSSSGTYTTPSYGGEVISSPSDATASIYTPPSSTYPSGTSQGAAAAAQYQTDADRSLASAVRQALNANRTVAPVAQRIFINSRNGAVTLSGTVPSEEDRQFIDNVVRNINGVYSVNDQMQVSAQPTGAADTRVYSTAPVVNNSSELGNIFNLHVQGLNEPDRTLAQRILQELRTDTILPSLLPMVNITISGGRVILEGNVQSEQQRRAIDAAVQRAAGVSNVNDQLQVTYTPAR